MLEFKALEPHEFGLDELNLLYEVSGSSFDEMTVEEYLEAMGNGHLGIWKIGNVGLIGLSRTNAKKNGERGVLWVEFVCGDIFDLAEDIVEWLRSVADGRRIEALAHRPGMIKMAKRMGFKPVATLMRLTDA